MFEVESHYPNQQEWPLFGVQADDDQDGGVMGGYFQVRRSLFSSTVWLNETPETRCLWVWILGEKNKRGFLDTPPLGMAHAANISLEATMAALERFQSPDPGSRTEEHEGRRLQKVRGGWIVLNHKQYDIRSGETPEQVASKQDGRRAADAKRKREARAAKKVAGDDVRASASANGAKRLMDATPRRRTVSVEITKEGAELAGASAGHRELVSEPIPNTQNPEPIRSAGEPAAAQIQTETKLPPPNPEIVKQAAKDLYDEWPHNDRSKERPQTVIDLFLRICRTEAELATYKAAAWQYQSDIPTWTADMADKTMTMTKFFTSAFDRFLPRDFDETNPLAWKPPTNEQVAQKLADYTTPTIDNVPDL